MPAGARQWFPRSLRALAFPRVPPSLQRLQERLVAFDATIDPVEVSHLAAR